MIYWHLLEAAIAHSLILYWQAMQNAQISKPNTCLLSIENTPFNLIYITILKIYQQYPSSLYNIRNQLWKDRTFGIQMEASARKQKMIKKIMTSWVLTANDVFVPCTCSLYTMPYWKMMNLRLKIVSATLPPKVRICPCQHTLLAPKIQWKKETLQVLIFSQKLLNETLVMGWYFKWEKFQVTLSLVSCNLLKLW